MLHAIIGPMKSSKSKRLIELAEQFERDGKKISIFYPAKLNKHDGYVYSRHNDKRIKATKVYDLNDLYNNVENVDVILLDEYTFYIDDNQSDEFMKFIEFCDTKNVEIYMFGLQLDYMARGFELAHRILPYADSIDVLTANCEICGEKNSAVRQVRYVDGNIDTNEDAETLQMESSNIEYKSCCRECYRKLTNKPAIR